MEDIEQALTSVSAKLSDTLKEGSSSQNEQQQSTATWAPAQPTVVSSAQATATESVLKGKVSENDITDGDTIKLLGKRVRLFGMDAPELSQTCKVAGKISPCGQLARAAMIGFIGDGEVTCLRQDVDRYGRDVSKCSVAGFDLSAGLVSAGLAVAYRQYSSLYVPEEEVAHAKGRGMWRGEFVMPWDWRRGKRLN